MGVNSFCRLFRQATTLSHASTPMLLNLSFAITLADESEFCSNVSASCCPHDLSVSLRLWANPGAVCALEGPRAHRCSGLCLPGPHGYTFCYLCLYQVIIYIYYSFTRHVHLHVDVKMYPLWLGVAIKYNQQRMLQLSISWPSMTCDLTADFGTPPWSSRPVVSSATSSWLEYVWATCAPSALSPSHT